MPTRKEGFGDYSLGLWENVAVDTNLFGFLLRFFHHRDPAPLDDGWSRRILFRPSSAHLSNSYDEAVLT